MKNFCRFLNLSVLLLFVFGIFLFFNVSYVSATPGASCSDSDTCDDDEICVPSGTSGSEGTCLNSCDNDNDCDEGFTCTDVGVGMTCIAGAVDSEDEEDRDGDDVPDSADSDNSCETNEDCSGELCSSGYCIPCTEDTQCGSGKLCVDGRCTDSDDVVITPDDGTRSNTDTGDSGVQGYDEWRQRQIDAANSAERGIFTEGLTTECMAFGDCGPCDIVKVISNIFRFAFEIVGIVAVVVISIGGITYIRSGGNEETAGQAKKIITAAILGTLIVFAAWIIINTILNITGFNVGGGNWWNPSC